MQDQKDATHNRAVFISQSQQQQQQQYRFFFPGLQGVIAIGGYSCDSAAVNLVAHLATTTLLACPRGTPGITDAFLPGAVGLAMFRLFSPQYAQEAAEDLGLKLALVEVVLAALYHDAGAAIAALEASGAGMSSRFFTTAVPLVPKECDSQGERKLVGLRRGGWGEGEGMGYEVWGLGCGVWGGGWGLCVFVWGWVGAKELKIRRYSGK